MATVPASGPSAQSQHATTTANTVDVVTLDQPYRYVEIVNRDAAAPLWVTVDIGTANPSTITPTVAGPGTLYVGPGAVRVIADDAFGYAGAATPPSTARVISTAAVAYSVTGLTAT